MNILNTYLTKRASVLPYLAATGGSGSAYYNEGGDLGQVATYNKAPIGDMNFYDMAYTMNDAALWLVPPVFKAPLILSKAPKLGKTLGTAIYNTYNKTPQFIKNMTANTAVTSLPYLGAEYAVTEGVMNRQAPKGVVGRYGIPIALYGYDNLYNQYEDVLAEMLSNKVIQSENVESAGNLEQSSNSSNLGFMMLPTTTTTFTLSNPLLHPILKSIK